MNESWYIEFTGPICEEPGKFENGYITVINGLPDDDGYNTLQNDVRYEKNNMRHSQELQQLEYKCNNGFLLWGNSLLTCQYNNR